MSYRYGLNGNDIDWDAIDFHCTETCINCEEYRKDTGDYPEECDGHLHRYSAKGWSMYHDANGNFVSTVGHVPFWIFTTDYLVEWLEALDDERNASAQKSRIRKALKYRPDYQYHAA